MADTFDRKVQRSIIVALVVFTLLPIIAPIAAKLELNFIADPIYWFYQWFCHQRPWRSYHLFDYQLAMDARMMMMFGAMAIGGIIVYLKKLSPLRPKYAVTFVLLLILPLAVDGTLQAIAEIFSSSNELPFYESTNFTRSITGILFGIGIAFGFLPFLNEHKNYVRLKDYVRPITIAIIISVVSLVILTFASWITSTKYQPSHPFIDIEARFPGYNYEITTSGEHSTIDRTLTIDDKPLYLERAAQFGRDDLISDYLLRSR